MSHGREKSHKLVMKTLSLATVTQWSTPAIRHWSGLYCFAAQFRRVLFSVLQEIFPFVQDMEDRGDLMEAEDGLFYIKRGEIAEKHTQRETFKSKDQMNPGSTEITDVMDHFAKCTPK